MSPFAPEGPTSPLTPTRRSVLSGAGATALGITSLALPAGTAAASVLENQGALVAATGGIVYGWGTEWSAGVFGTQSGSKTAPVVVTGTSFTWPEVVQVISSRYTSFALTADGDVYGFGAGNESKLGNGSTADRTTPTQATISGVTQLAGGSFWTLALKASGAIWSWGGASAAAGLTSTALTPIDVTATLGLTSLVDGADRVIQVSSGIAVSIALTALGRVLTFGTQGASFPKGVLGIGSADAATNTTATEIGAASGGAFEGLAGTAGRISQVSTNAYHCLAVSRDGRVFAWGEQNSSGPLGNGTTNDDELEPLDISAQGDLDGTVGTDARIIQVSAGGNWSLALGLDGAVYAWGAASSGRLGNGTTSPVVTVPQRITGIAGSALPATSDTSRRIIQVSAREENGYALGADGRVYAWGNGARVGDGSSTTRTLPVEITASGAFADLSPNAGASLSPRRIVGLATGSIQDAPHMLAIDNRGIVAP